MGTMKSSTAITLLMLSTAVQAVRVQLWCPALCQESPGQCPTLDSHESKIVDKKNIFQNGVPTYDKFSCSGCSSELIIKFVPCLQPGWTTNLQPNAEGRVVYTHKDEEPTVIRPGLCYHRFDMTATDYAVNLACFDKITCYTQNCNASCEPEPVYDCKAPPRVMPMAPGSKIPNEIRERFPKKHTISGPTPANLPGCTFGKTLVDRRRRLINRFFRESIRCQQS